MKTRRGFVSNSSSSSFVVSKSAMPKATWKRVVVRNARSIEPWTLEESKHYYSGKCFMDNYDIISDMVELGVPEYAISVGGSHTSIDELKKDYVDFLFKNGRR